MTLSRQLREALSRPLPSEVRLAAGDRRRQTAERAHVEAAVLVPIVDRPNPGLLLTQRNANLRTHAGQVAFPGGRIDPDDDGPVGAAIREACEEIGLAPAHVDVIGTLDPYLTGSNYRITPVLAVVPPDLPLSPHEAEVEAIFEVPLSFLRDRTNWIRVPFTWEGAEHHYYEVLWEDRRIWGATAAILVNIGRRLQYAA